MYTCIDGIITIPERIIFSNAVCHARTQMDSLITESGTIYILEELVEMDLGIKMAEEKLERLSSDPKTVDLYQAREDVAHERANLISTGVQQGIQQGIYEVAINLLDILDNEMISKKQVCH